MSIFVVALQAEAPTDTTRKYHTFLFLNVFRDVAGSFLNRIDFSPNDPTKNIQFTTFDHLLDTTCALLFANAQMVNFSAIWWRNLDGNFHIEYMPNSVETLRVVLCEQNFILNTRYFPRNAKHIDFAQNAIQGTIELGILPQRLVTLNLSWNRLTGKILLERLPQSLETLDLQWNLKILQTIVYYGDLPKSLKRIDLKQITDQVEPIDEIYRLEDESIFDLQRPGEPFRQQAMND